MLPSEKIDLTIYKLQREPYEWRTVSIGSLATETGCTTQVLVDVLKRLESQEYILLKKHSSARGYVEGSVNMEEKDFFYVGHFELKIAPKGQPYFERLASAVESSEEDSTESGELVVRDAKLKEILKADSRGARVISTKGKPTNRVLLTTFNEYELIEVIGQGGTGQVWRATDSNGTPVAVKILDAERTTRDRRKRFKNEILFCLNARHPNVISVLDFGIKIADEASTPFYVMPLLHGSMRQLLPTVPDSVQRIKYFDQMLSGVEAAHVQGVVHRDLKPENILYDGDNDRLVVADFGIAEFSDEELYTAVETKNSDRMANFHYAAPEQKVRGRSTDVRTDIFALGLMLNEMFTGQIPQGTEYKTVAAVAPDSAWLDDLVGQMIRQDPKQRLASIDAVKRALQTFQQEYVTRQRLSQIQNTVIPVGEEDDPLAFEAPKIVDFDWKNDEVTVVFDRRVNGGWEQAFRHIGPQQWIGRVTPHTVRIVGDRLIAHAQEHEVQTAVNYIKNWLPKVTEQYRIEREEARRRATEEEKRGLSRAQLKFPRSEKATLTGPRAGELADDTCTT